MGSKRAQVKRVSDLTSAVPTRHRPERSQRENPEGCFRIQTRQPVRRFQNGRQRNTNQHHRHCRDRHLQRKSQTDLPLPLADPTHLENTGNFSEAQALVEIGSPAALEQALDGLRPLRVEGWPLTQVHHAVVEVRSL